MTRRLREATLWAGAALGLLSVAAGVAVMFFGFTFLIFRSGSMGPEIPTGSLALARTVPAAELEAGDVISVLAANGARVTHRLVSSTVRGDEASLILQGDANSTPDEEIYQVTEAQRSIVAAPYVGYAVTVLLSPAGLLAAVCLSGMLMLLAYGSPAPVDGGATQHGGRHRAEKPPNRRALVSTGVGASLVAVAVAGAGVNGTSAFYTDRATTTSSTFSMAAPANPPRNVACQAVLLPLPGGNYVTWDAPATGSPTGYILTFTSKGGVETRAVPLTPRQARPTQPNGNTDFDVTIVATYASGNSAVVSTRISWAQNLQLWTC